MKNINKNEDGFTLIEILVTICIIGILAAVVIPVYLNIKKGVLDDNAIADAIGLQKNVDIYRGDNLRVVPATIEQSGYKQPSDDIVVSYKATKFDYCIFTYHIDGGKKYTASNPYTVYNGQVGTCPL